ncbi:peroxisomal membrane protein PMP34 [Coccinella septempunctata]|uniref:peroxisomal membrane protein PMP34 n=1 Tax=Coccinella septempunctata TaxID=41139 RepID=UPI001D0870B1|nr:peroxisomal membrane protein PMP34 [Coccinella septempunctata]
MSLSKSSIFTYENLVHAIAGAAGGIFSMVCFYPLETIKFRMQLEDVALKDKTTQEAIIHILKNEGVEALYRGCQPCLNSIAVSSFVFFYSFHSLKSLKFGELNNTAQLDMLLSCLAGFVNICTTTPLWVVNNRLKLQKQLYYTGLLDGMFHIAKNEGIGALWSSFIPSLILLVNPVIHFTVYESLKRHVRTDSAWAFFLMGAVSKTIATLVTYPLQVVQTKQRAERNLGPGTLAILLSMIKKDGPKSLYRGMESKLLQTVLMAALTFMTYEKIVRLIFTIVMASSKYKKQKS